MNNFGVRNHFPKTVTPTTNSRNTIINKHFLNTSVLWAVLLATLWVHFIISCFYVKSSWKRGIRLAEHKELVPPTFSKGNQGTHQLTAELYGRFSKQRQKVYSLKTCQIQKSGTYSSRIFYKMLNSTTYNKSQTLVLRNVLKPFLNIIYFTIFVSVKTTHLNPPVVSDRLLGDLARKTCKPHVAHPNYTEIRIVQCYQIMPTMREAPQNDKIF